MTSVDVAKFGGVVTAGTRHHAHGTDIGDSSGQWDGLVLQLAPDRMLLGPEAARVFAAALDRVRRTDGVALSPTLEHVRRMALRVASPAGCGHADVRNPPQSPDSQAWIGTTQIAEQLGLSQRQSHRLVTDGVFGEPRRSRGKWVVLQIEVAAVAAERRRNVE